MPIVVAQTPKTKEKKAREQDLQADTVLQQIKDATPEQINNYIDANVTDLPSAKVFIKRLTRLVVYILKKVD